MLEDKKQQEVLEEEVKEEIVEDQVEVTEEVEEREEESAEVIEEKEYPTFESKEDFDKFVQSTASKAKNELLKELGVANIAAAKVLLEAGKEFDLTKQELTDLKTVNENLVKENQTMKDAILIRDFGISEEFSKQFIQLVNSDDSGESREVIAERVAGILQSGAIFKDQPVTKIVIGGEGSKEEPEFETPEQKAFKQGLGLK